MDTRLRASPRHGGAGKFFLNFFKSPIRRGGVRLRGGGSHHKREESGDNLRIIADYYDFYGKCSITIYTLQGVSHPRCGSPDTINPEQVRYHHRSALGRYRGQARFPPS